MMKNIFKRYLMAVSALLCVVTGALAQRSYNFNAVALNVDGLPNEILGITINSDGKEEAGATALCGILANSGWDFVGFSEDFNFHDYLTATPASTYYNFGEHGGKVSSISNSTDGLGFACLKKLSFSGGSKVAWTSEYGGSGLTSIGDNGADNMIDKGFRMYTVTFATGVAVDVYVLHMDAATADSDDDYDSNGKDKNIVAREEQLSQLATYIKNNHNGRPVIIIGDTNCRYTREALKTGFIDVINADSRFTIKDAWVEKIWNGTYPTYGSSSMMTSSYGSQKGEIVDKIFYINTTASDLTLVANSYLHDTSIAISDHYPVVVNFTIIDPNGTVLTEEEKKDNWTLEELEEGDGVNPKPTWEGEQVVSGTTYYMMNVGTGEYIKWGGAYLTEAVAGNGGTPITPTTTDGSAWLLKTSRNHLGYPSNGTDIYLDALLDVATWYLEPISGTEYQYRLKSANGTYLTTTPSESHKPIRRVSYNADDDNQKWIFLTDDRIRTEMTKANAVYPFNFTALLKSADFDLIEYEDGWTNNWIGFDWSGEGTSNVSGNGPFKGACSGWDPDASKYVSYAYANSTDATSMSQDLGTLPNGTYNISFEGFYRSQYTYKGGFLNLTTYTEDETLSGAVVSFGSTNIAIPNNQSTDIGADVSTVGSLFRSTDTYYTNGTSTLSESQAVTLSVTKPATRSTAKAAWICIDNFRLDYYGTGEVVVDPTVAYRNQVIKKVNETYEKVILLNEAGQAAYDISPVMHCYNNGFITSQAIADKLCAMVDAAYECAYTAHLAAEQSNVTDGLQVHFTFEDLKSKVGNYTGTLYNEAALTTLGDLPVLSLGSSDGYFDMSASVGNVIAVLDNFTISTNVYIPTTTSLSGNGNFIYTFANSTDIATDANGCIFFRTGVSDTRYAISTTRYDTEKALTISESPFTDGDWHTVTYRQTSNNGEIFIDGQLVVSGAISINPKTLGATPYNFLGRPCYVGDAYLKDAMYNDFRIYKGAVDDATLIEFTANLDALNTALYKVQIAALMDKITLDDVLYNNVELPTAGENGITITWSTSNASAVSVTGQVVRPAYGQPDANVTLTATFTKGSVSEQKTFAVTIPAWEMDDNASVQADLEAIVLKGRLDNLMSNLYLPTASLQGSTITWQSSAPEYLDTNGELLQQHPDKKYSVVLTATATKGSATATRTFNICLAVKLPLKYYLFAYFNGNAQSQEQICFAISKDGYNYTPLNKGNPIINSSDIANKQAVRDPHILRGEDGYFYMVVTDMRSDDGWSSNDGLVLLRSDDMVTWTHSAIDFPTRWPERFDRDALTQVWAPQTIYDPEEDKYMVYYAIGESGKNYITYYSYANEDFTDLTEPQVLYNHSGNNTIDADIVYYKGQYHMFFKTEGQGNGIQKATAKTLRGEWTPGNQYLQQTTVAVEGSGVFRLIDSDTWILMYDCYTSGMYEYCTSTDLTNFTYKCNSANTDIFTPRHGTTIIITSEEACRLLKKWPTGTDFDNIPLELYDTSDKAPRGVDGDYTEVTMHRTLKAKTTDDKAAWNSFVVPFDISSTTLGEEWEVKELTHSELDGDMLTLTFSAAEDGIKAGIPYMVRNASMTETLSSFTLENVKVNTELRPTTIGDVTFTGVYHYDYIPKGVFFINDNIFYQVKEDNKNKSKGYRAYIELSDNVSANVRNLSFRTDDDDNNNDDTPVVPATGGATVVAIYNTNGMRIDNLHDGINILQMSDGTTMKVVIK